MNLTEARLEHKPKPNDRTHMHESINQIGNKAFTQKPKP